MIRPSACPRCGSIDIVERLHVPEHGGSNVDFVRVLCGQPAGPAITPKPAPPCVVLPFARPAAKPSRASGPSVSRFAPLRGYVP